MRHVLLTHAHPDHCAPAFLLFRSWVSAGEPLDVVGPADVVEQARMWLAPDSPVRFRTVRAGDRLTLGAYDVRVHRARHGAEDACVLFDVTGPGGRLLYATDTGPLPDDTVEAVRGAAYDVLLMEETFGDLGTHGTDHLDLVTFPEQLRRLREAGAVTDGTDVVAVHLSHHNPPTDELDRRLAGWGARVVDDGTTLGEPSHPARAARTDPGGRRRPLREVQRGRAAAGRGPRRDLRGDRLPRRRRRRVVRPGAAAPGAAPRAAGRPWRPSTWRRCWRPRAVRCSSTA